MVWWSVGSNEHYVPLLLSIGRSGGRRPLVAKSTGSKDWSVFFFSSSGCCCCLTRQLSIDYFHPHLSLFVILLIQFFTLNDWRQKRRGKDFFYFFDCFLFKSKWRWRTRLDNSIATQLCKKKQGFALLFLNLLYINKIVCETAAVALFSQSRETPAPSRKKLHQTVRRQQPISPLPPPPP